MAIVVEVLELLEQLVVLTCLVNNVKLVGELVTLNGLVLELAVLELVTKVLET